MSESKNTNGQRARKIRVGAGADVSKEAMDRFVGDSASLRRVEAALAAVEAAWAELDEANAVHWARHEARGGLVRDHATAAKNADAVMRFLRNALYSADTWERLAKIAKIAESPRDELNKKEKMAILVRSCEAALLRRASPVAVFGLLGKWLPPEQREAARDQVTAMVDRYTPNPKKTATGRAAGGASKISSARRFAADFASKFNLLGYDSKKHAQAIRDFGKLAPLKPRR